MQIQDGIAYMAHVGGLVSGATLFPLLRDRAVRLFECLRPVEQPPGPSQVS